ncbi:MAG TPA: hypothetical protein VFS43_05155 [Polyangiaceae bacterium]|nr:hypothetical protein [Polyangiaceae bacterium]
MVRSRPSGARAGRQTPIALALWLVAAPWLDGCSVSAEVSRRPARAPQPPAPRAEVVEAPVVTLPLAPPLDDPTAELSDLAWAGDELFLLPQFPARFGAGGSLFKIRRADIERWLDGDRRGALDVTPVAFDGGGVVERIDGFQGFEALAIEGDRLYLTAESRSEGRMRAHLMRGELDVGRARAGVRADTMVELPCPGSLGNLSYEALTVYRGSVVTFYESNGHAIVSEPAALFWDELLHSFERRPMSPLEYRVTGASAADAAGRFWVTNVFWPGEKALRADDPIAAAYGRGATHARSETVERLVELRIGPGGVERTPTAPLQLALARDERTRNWEGIARLGERGFLLVADEHPTTILAFVPSEGGARPR